MRLPDSEYESRPWRIHDIAPDFELEDVWQLPVEGERDDLPLLVERFAAGDPAEGPSRAVRILFALRWKIGELLRWDDADDGLGSRAPSLRDRLPSDLRDATAPEFESLPFEPLYMTVHEFAAEIANKTMHGVLHIGWVEGDDGRYRGQLAVLVKRNGFFGAAYMAAIRPFRHLIVYPAMMRQIEREAQEVAAAR